MEDAGLLARADVDGATLLDRMLEELGRIDDDTAEELSLTDEELTRAEDDALDRETEAELPIEEEWTDSELLGRALAELLRRTLELDRTADDDATLLVRAADEALLDRTADEERTEDGEARVDELALESDTAEEAMLLDRAAEDILLLERAADDEDARMDEDGSALLERAEEAELLGLVLEELDRATEDDGALL
ncbi:hypothetical protein R3P38DRAFT_3173803 [Favolaschia claudopus]|uniref:Uncharacterized protein n=1 Tax=Favolaschia claudopus TaxID=2862362 RepID=A0AAW0DFX0_9AGAR